MIKINISYDIVIKVEDVDSLQDSLSGVYIFLDEKNNPLYVGITSDLKGRLKHHLDKKTNTKRFSYLFKKLALIQEEDPLLRRIAEIYLINTLNTPINKSSVYPEGMKAQSVASTLYSGQKNAQCKGLTNEGKRCKLPGHTNGFCFLHGGNGMSLTKIAQEAAQKAKDQASALLEGEDTN